MEHPVESFQKYHEWISSIKNLNVAPKSVSIYLWETHSVVGVVVAIRVGHHLQEDVHLVEDGGESGVTSIISRNLLTEM